MDGGTNAGGDDGSGSANVPTGGGARCATAGCNTVPSAGGARCAGAGCFVRHLVVICRRGDPSDVDLDNLQHGRVDLKARFIAAALCLSGDLRHNTTVSLCHPLLGATLARRKFRGTPDCNESAALHSYGLDAHYR